MIILFVNFWLFKNQPGPKLSDYLSLCVHVPLTSCTLPKCSGNLWRVEISFSTFHLTIASSSSSLFLVWLLSVWKFTLFNVDNCFKMLTWRVTYSLLNQGPILQKIYLFTFPITTLLSVVLKCSLEDKHTVFWTRA